MDVESELEVAKLQLTPLGIARQQLAVLAELKRQVVEMKRKHAQEVSDAHKVRF